MDNTAVEIKQMDEKAATMQELNDTFKSDLFESMDKNIPSKEIRSKIDYPG